MKQKVRISDAELDIMRVLWQSHNPMKASEIVKELSGDRTWKTQTCHVLLGRLAEKGYVDADRSGYTHKFFPALSEEEFLAKQSSTLAERVGSTLPSMIASLIDANNVTEEELDEISALLAAKRRELANGKKN
ncbi:MAG: BlaI/MecI/CopY family transcriptional regulator [Clostridia bacterium]|nr:BlaI/MecI/CopY family transcriptional regulator [Clostridia bacterium]